MSNFLSGSSCILATLRSQGIKKVNRLTYHQKWERQTSKLQLHPTSRRDHLLTLFTSYCIYMNVAFNVLTQL